MNEIYVWLGIFFCVTQLAMFSGLNLAFFSYTRLRLEIEAESASSKGADKVLKMRKDSNFLLTTILALNRVQWIIQPASLPEKDMFNAANFRLDGAIALVTGAGSGLGEATARRFAKEGAHVVITDINAQQAETVCQDITAAGGSAEHHYQDVTDELAWDTLVGMIVKDHGKLDVVVNNAGIVIRGSVEDTVIEEGVKIDNQVQVAHNVFIGAQTAIAACVGICGSTRIGSYCTLAGGVGVLGHLEIADHVHVTGMSMVTRSLSEPGTYSAGTPLMGNRQWRRNAVRIKQLDRLTRRVSRLEKSK